MTTVAVTGMIVALALVVWNHDRRLKRVEEYLRRLDIARGGRVE